MTVDSPSIRPNESVSSRAVVEGMTSVAAMRVTPTTLIEATMVAAIARAKRLSVSPTSTPWIAATSGSNVMNSNRL
jgi:hypothetical protein